jgi:hypothetical protein
MYEETIVVPGDPEARGLVAIWSDTRPHPSHCWARAALHCFNFKNVNYFVQLESATACYHMAEAIRIIPRPPQRAIEWGWGKGWPGQ